MTVGKKLIVDADLGFVLLSYVCFFYFLALSESWVFVLQLYNMSFVLFLSLSEAIVYPYSINNYNYVCRIKSVIFAISWGKNI